MTNKEIHKLLVITGSIILFGSWVIDNFLQKERDEKIITANNDVISLQIVRCIEMNSKFAYEYYRDKYYYNTKDSSAIYNMAYFGGDHGIALLGQGEMLKYILNSNDKQKLQMLDSMGYKYDSLLRHYHKNKQLDSLQDVLDTIDKNYRTTNEEENRRKQIYLKLLANSKNARTVFLAMYILGSLALGIAYIIKKD